jgi:hypothetical protein
MMLGGIRTREHASRYIIAAHIRDAADPRSTEDKGCSDDQKIMAVVFMLSGLPHEILKVRRLVISPQKKAPPAPRAPASVGVKHRLHTQ